MADIESIFINGSIAEIGDLYRKRRTSVTEAVKWYLARIERLGDLNAVREVSGTALEEAKRADEALASGRDAGPLHGIPVLLKDNIFVSGLRASAGVKALADFRPPRDASLVTRCDHTGQNQPDGVCRLRLRHHAVGIQRRRRRGQEPARHSL